jgi:hypothetical protein
VGFAVVEEHVLLFVVEIWFTIDSSVRFFGGDLDGTDVDAVPFQPGLEEDAFWFDVGDIEGGEEGLEQAACVSVFSSSGF